MAANYNNAIAQFILDHDINLTYHILIINPNNTFAYIESFADIGGYHEAGNHYIDVLNWTHIEFRLINGGAAQVGIIRRST